MNYKEIFEAAQSKGYMLRQESLEDGTILYNSELEEFIELMLIHRWLIEKYNVHIEPVSKINDEGIVEKRYRVLMIYPPEKYTSGPRPRYAMRDFTGDDELVVTKMALELL